MFPSLSHTRNLKKYQFPVRIFQVLKVHTNPALIYQILFIARDFLKMLNEFVIATLCNSLGFTTYSLSVRTSRACCFQNCIRASLYFESTALTE